MLSKKRRKKSNPIEKRRRRRRINNNSSNKSESNLHKLRKRKRKQETGTQVMRCDDSEVCSTRLYFILGAFEERDGEMKLWQDQERHHRDRLWNRMTSLVHHHSRVRKELKGISVVLFVVDVLSKKKKIPLLPRG